MFLRDLGFFWNGGKFMINWLFFFKVYEIYILVFRVFVLKKKIYLEGREYVSKWELIVNGGILGIRMGRCLVGRWLV